MTRAQNVFVATAMGIAIAGIVLGASPASAQESTADGVREQLDRIEQKLDRLLERLDRTSTTDQPLRAGATMLPTPEDGKPVTAAPDAPPPAVAAETESTAYKSGAVAIARTAPERANALPDIPADSVGSFVYSGGAIPLSELSRSNVRYNGLAAIELQGWLKITQAGRTQLAVEYRATTGSNVFVDPTCITAIWLEDRSIGSERAEIPMPAREEKTISMVFGADLEPGLYRLRAWLACTPPRDLRRLNAELLIKSTSDMNLRTVTGSDLLHKGG